VPYVLTDSIKRPSSLATAPSLESLKAMQKEQAGLLYPQQYHLLFAKKQNCRLKKYKDSK
jgi:hypothetical protein